MATVHFDGTRVNDADTLTGWAADGVSSLSVEPDWYYQGSACISGLVKTAEVGMYYTSGNQNLASTNGTWLAKFNQTNKNAIDGNGLQLRIGSTTAAYNYYYIYTALTYPIAGGFQIVPINPNVTGYATGVTGTPNFSTTTVWHLRSDCSATAKTQNLGMDAVDWMPNSSGLTLSGTSGNFEDYVTFDEGTQNNRYGVVTTKESIMYVLGTLTIGTSNTTTTFSAIDRTLVFPDARVDYGFSGIKLDLSNNSTDISLTNITFISRGVTGDTKDTRSLFTVFNTGGTSSIISCVLTNFSLISPNIKSPITDSTLNNCGTLIQNNSYITGTVFNKFTSGTTILSDDPAKITYCDFLSDGSNHALEITTPGTYSFIGNTFTDYATISGSTGNEAIYNNSGGLVTINVTGGDTPTYRNGTSATTVVNNNITITFTGLKDLTEVRVFAAGTTTELAGIEDATDGTVNNRFFTFSIAVGTHIDYRIHNLSYVIIEVYDYTAPSTSTSLPIQQQTDRWVI